MNPPTQLFPLPATTQIFGARPVPGRSGFGLHRRFNSVDHRRTVSTRCAPGLRPSKRRTMICQQWLRPAKAGRRALRIGSGYAGLRSVDHSTRILAIAAAIWFGTASSGHAAGSQSAIPSSEPTGFLVRTNYHGWENSILVSNGRIEAVIVPAIGRVLQFRLAGEKDGPFWENPALFGKAPDPV